MSAKKTAKPAATAKTEKKAKGQASDAKKKAAKPAAKTASKSIAEKEQNKPVAAPAPAALTHSALTPPAKASVVTPAVKEATPLATREQSKTPALRAENTSPVVQADKSLALTAPTSAAALSDVAPSASVMLKPHSASNPYLPEVATVVEVIDETSNIKTFRVVLDNMEAMRAFSYAPGQVGQLSLFGVGEATFVINSPPSQKGYLQFSVMRAGEVTEALHRLAPGDKVGVRAPLGNAFPFKQWKGKNIFFVGGGIGMAPIRTIMMHVLENKQDYGTVSLLYGARSPRDMAYSYELNGWLRDPNLDCHLAIDAPSEGWPHKVGLIPHVLLDIKPSPENTVAVLCGPPIMIKFTVEALKKLNFPDENIITTLEKRMKCGIGICGRCNIGTKYVCVDGPVFSWAELKDLPPEL